MSAPSAHLAIGGQYPSGLYRVPQVAEAQKPGEITIILGRTMSGLPVTLTITSLEWLDDLGAAVLVAVAQGIVEAGMAKP